MFRFRECREQRGIAQKNVAISLGVKAPSVSEWENGRSNPSLDNLIALADLFGVTTDYLLGRDNRMMDVKTDLKDGDSFSTGEMALITAFRQLNAKGKEKALAYLRDLNEMPSMKEEQAIQKMA